MKVKLWGTRGSLATPGPETIRYGGNTSCVQVLGSEGTVLVLDAGTGIRQLGMLLPPTLRRVDILLTHLHMDHLQGLAFFPQMRNPECEVHIWGPASTTLSLHNRLTRYISPPLFPIFLREMTAPRFLHEVPQGDFDIGEFHIKCDLICHPDPTVGFRITSPDGSITYLPDHEPALGMQHFPGDKDWTSGYKLAEGTDLLIHDSQYSMEEYREYIGFGHSAIDQTLAFAKLTDAKHLVPFHHDPSHTDEMLDRMFAESIERAQPAFKVTPAMEGSVFEVGGDQRMK